MPCYHPVEAWQLDNGQVVFVERGQVARSLFLPCGRCVGCRLERSRQWAVRCMHEAQLHDENCFVTLTYSDEHLPRDMSLKYDHFQRFMKRLRKHFAPRKFRFYMCGEYGEQFGRPHYHACFFGLDFPDKLLVRGGNRENELYTSEVLERIWGYGSAKIGAVTFESAAYVARYVMKKVTGDEAEAHYRFVDLETGEVFQRTPEFCQMSRHGGIGKFWFDKFACDVYPHDYVVARGVKSKPPRFYDKLYKRVNADGFADVQERREVGALRYKADNTPRRLSDRETVAKARLKQYRRVL